MSIVATGMHSPICLLVAAMLGSAVAIAFGADTQPSEAPPVAVPFSPAGHPNVLGTTFVDWDAMTVRSSVTGQGRAVFDNPTPTLEKFEVHITTLRPGMISHPVHQHAWEEMLLVKEGTLESSINGKKYQAGPGSLIFYASHDPHNLKNAGDVPATYYVMNFYTDRVHTVADKPALEQAVPGMLQSGVIDCNSMPATPTKIGTTTNVVNSPTLTFKTFASHITTLNVGQMTQKDIVDSGDELFIVKTGQLEVTVNGITTRIKEGSLFYCAPNDKRTLKNIGNAPAAYQVIKIVSERTPA